CTVVQLKRRNWDGPEECKLCKEQEDADHIIFRCPLASFVWCWIRDSLGWDGIPDSLSEFADRRLGDGSKPKRELMIYLLASVSWVLASVSWVLWRTRNDWVFSNILINNPKSLAYKVIVFLQFWSKMASVEGQTRRERLPLKLEQGLRRI
uniref:Reverse transcriptase zinc-binding domain-containing protein n=1 Tax=Setaria italica TaxID=4555 RepID=K3XSK2_SETIT